MSVDSAYSAVPFIYKSRGLSARPIEDQAPEYVYLQLLNCLEREENAMSSRYGTIIVNRDPAGVGTSNYFWNSPVTSLAKLNYQSGAYRYAGLANGTLQRRTGNTQGAYTQLTLPTTITGAPVVLSGNTFMSVVDNCFETSQAYLFIADAAASIKDQGTGNPQLWGIDPPQYTANTQPFSPLLTLIDNFATGNSYTSSGFDGGSPWTYGAVTTLSDLSGSLVTDFPQFTYTGETLAGGVTSATSTNDVFASTTNTYSGFSALSINGMATLNVPVTAATLTGTHGFGRPVGGYTLSYSVDGGATWTPFYSTSGPFFTAQTITASFYVVNASSVQVQITVSTNSKNPGTSTMSVTLGTMSIIEDSIGYFGGICNGILSVLNTNSTIKIPIVNVSNVASGSNLFIVTCAKAHGLAGGNFIALYGTSNDLLDGFYEVASAPTSTTFTIITNIASISSVTTSATGGFVMGGAAAPSTAVLANEYASPYPIQLSAWGFYQQVPIATTSFPIGAWSGLVDTNSTATVGVTANFDLSINDQVNDSDLIVLTLNVGSPANISNIRLQFDVNGSGYTSSYYYANITPAYYQGNIANQESAYNTTESQILADTLGLITGQPPSTTTAQLQPSNFSTGSGAWVAVYIPRGNFLPVGQAGQAGLDWSNITGWQLVITTTAAVVTGDGSSTVACNGLYLQWGYGPSSFAGVGYEYRYTYYNANTGTESSPNPEMQFNETFGYLSSLSAPFYLRQAVDVLGFYSPDTQVTHVRVYRRGGIYNDNWRLIDQIQNIASSTLLQFQYKDVIADAFIAQAPTLTLDNDPPVTSSLLNPIQTSLSLATTGPGSSYYSTYSPQTITVANATAVFIPNQLVEIGTAANLEVVSVITGGTGTFTAIVRLQHNAGEQVNIYAVPRQPCNLCAVAYSQMWLAGDENNPHYLYFSKPGLPENFGPQNYIPVGTPDAPINAVINWRGTLFVGTSKTWWIIPGSQRPPQPTGSVHGIVAQNGWIEVEGAIWYQAADGLREFTGAEGVYKTLPVEWIFRGNPQCLPPQADPTQFSQTVMAFYNNTVFASYVSLNSGQRYRLIYDTNYQRYRQDDVPATAMLWEKDTNALLVGKQISPGNYVVVQDQVGDYDDGGWNGASLVKTPINITIQHPYRDLGKPHQPKQWNMIDTDVNTQNQVLQTTLLFEDGTISIPLAAQDTGFARQKCEMIVTGAGQPQGGGQQAYRASILHTMAVTVAPTIYQEDIYAALVAEYNGSWDSYWLKFGTDDEKFIKEAIFDYTSPVDIGVSLYADGSSTPYWTFTLPAKTLRYVMRVRFGNLNSGTTAFTMRTWRAIALTTSNADPLVSFQFWRKPQVKWKPAGQHSYKIVELEV